MKKIQTRIKPEHAQQLGINITPSGNYRLTEEQYRELQEIRTKQVTSKFEQHCETQGINPNDVSLYWDKTQNYSVLVRPEVVKMTNDQFIDTLYDRISKHAPNYEKLPVLNHNSNNLLVIDIADAHFGKLASAYETGQSYNIESAKQRCIEGVNGIVSKGRAFGIDKVLFIIGNDVLHYDNPRRTTTSGTPQDSDGMWFDMFNTALQTHVDIIEMLIQEFNVDILFCPSNHDYTSGWYFAKTLSAWFRNCDRVTIDDSIAHRKYYKYGSSLISASHGDGAKMGDMPLLMANEVPELWASTIYRHVYLHHIHHKQVNKFMSGKDYIGATVEYLRSPSSSDSWHHRNGYTGNKKAIEGFIHNFNDGQIARLTHYFV